VAGFESLVGKCVNLIDFQWLFDRAPSRPLLMMMVRCDSNSSESVTAQTQASGYFVSGWKSSAANNNKIVATSPITHSMMITDAHTTTTGIWPLDLEGHTRNIRPDSEQFSRTRSGTWP
jgi:hypothetical protein